MFGAQQIKAYKSIMKGTQYLPRRRESGARLFRCIFGGALIVVGAVSAGVVAGKIAGVDFAAEPVFLLAVPGMLVLWWLLDEAPVIGRWLFLMTSYLAAFVCALAGALSMRMESGSLLWLVLQFAALTLYFFAVSRATLRQLRPDMS